MALIIRDVYFKFDGKGLIFGFLLLRVVQENVDQQVFQDLWEQRARLDSRAPLAPLGHQDEASV